VIKNETRENCDAPLAAERPPVRRSVDAIAMLEPAPYLLSVRLKPERVQSVEYPFNLPLVRSLDIQFRSPVTFFVGENGTGKSTVMEALAALCRLPVSGGSRNELSANHGPDESSALATALRPSFRRRPPDGYFLRAEFQAHFASLLDARNADPDFRPYGDPYAPVGLIRFGGHLPKGGYDVQTDGRAPQEPASAPAIR
jgi:hypothetical protein